MVSDKVDLFIGVILIIIGMMLKFIYKYYEEKVLSKKSMKEQFDYKKQQKELSDMGAYNVPFKNSKLISTGNTIHDRNKFIIILGIFITIFSIFKIIFRMV